MSLNALVCMLFMENEKLKKSLVSLATLVVLLFVPLTIVEGAVYSISVSPSVPSNLKAPSLLAETNSTSLVILVLVNSTIHNGVKGSLEQYQRDLENFGFEDVIVLNWSEPNPMRVRETLRAFHLNSSLAGVLMVGDLPMAEYEMFTEWDYERFPIDLYYMDLDGNWTDSDADGVFDKHFGKVAPEIWVGRIKASNLGGDEISLINKYFEKNHRYRTGLLSSPRRALLYIDDDWVNYVTMDDHSLRLLYDDVATVTDKTATNATDFKNRLKQSYEWVHLRSHGNWDRHYFMVPGGNGSVIYSPEYADIDPAALFYQLFVCSATRYTEPNYLAGQIVFNTNYGLLAVGSTKLGGMLMFWTFYEAIARGRTIGDAFKEWFVKWGEGEVGLSGHYIGKKWFYGLTIIGDPTLRLRWLGAREIAELQKREEEVIDDLPLVLDLQKQISSVQVNYSSLSSDFDNLMDSYSTLQATHIDVAAQLADIRSLLYFFLLTTTVLVVANIYLVKSKSKSKTNNYG
jgi:hypothetical protein